MEENLEKSVYVGVFMYNWISWLCTWIIANQLYSSKKSKRKEKCKEMIWVMNESTEEFSLTGVRMG